MDAIQAPALRSALDPTARHVAPGETDLATAATAFEGYLVGAMLRIGTRPIGGDETPFDGGAGGRMYRELFFEEIRSCLEGNEQVKLSGFGNFDLRDKSQRPGRNPKTGEEIPISARRVVTFRPGQKRKGMIIL